MTSLIPLPDIPFEVPFPTQDWEVAAPPNAAVGAALDDLLSGAVGETEALGETRAALIVQGGRIIAERYASGYSAADTYPSWSKAKSITHALIGILVRDGKLDIHAPADVPEWQGAGDPRAVITLDQLLRMSSGLRFVEDYEDDGVSDVINMLFGEGKDDVAAFAANMPLEHAPGSHWSYASGTTNIIARMASRALGGGEAAFRAFMFDELFKPLGMTSPMPKFDAAGTFIGSSFCYCTARDFARFGLLYLRGGVWDGQRILPKGWADYARTPTPQPPGEPLGYGAHWWLGMGGPGSFSANGYEGQYTICLPDVDAVIVRHGKSSLDQKDAVQAWLRGVADALRARRLPGQGA